MNSLDEKNVSRYFKDALILPAPEVGSIVLPIGGNRAVATEAQ